MAKRTSRQLQVDRFQGAQTFLDRAIIKLGEAAEVYEDRDPDRSLELQNIISAIIEVQSAVKRFRYDRS